MHNKTILFSLIALFGILSTTSSAQKPTPIERSMPEAVEITKNMKYASYGDRTLLLDLYRPSKRTGAVLPTIIVIRGGGFRVGDKEGFGPMAAALAIRGFATVCIEYRPSGEALFPAAVFDSKSAVKWVKDHADKYQLDPNSIGAIGGSAGAHLAMMLGVSSEVKAVNPTESPRDYRINAVVGLAPPTDFTVLQEGEALADWLGKSYHESAELWRLASPNTHIDKNAPPMLFMHSSVDRTVPFEQSLAGVKIFGAKGVYTELFLIPNAPHAFWNYKEWFDYTMDKAALFFHEQLQKK